jgi:2-hydroxy-3-keto-5-methylthiopentenyl-1-phosphate phosphatase
MITIASFVYNDFDMTIPYQDSFKDSTDYYVNNDMEPEKYINPQTQVQPRLGHW